MPYAARVCPDGRIQTVKEHTDGVCQKAEKDAQLIESISHRLQNVYADLEKNPHLAEMRKAEDGLSEVINEINDAVRFTIDPDSANCTHDCSTCGGHCH